MARGNARQDIVLNDCDRQQWMRVLERNKNQRLTPSLLESYNGERDPGLGDDKSLNTNFYQTG